MKEFLSSGKFDTVLGWVWLVIGSLSIVIGVTEQGSASLYLGFLQILLSLGRFEVAGLKCKLNDKGEK